jgi:hypothetical protein
MCAETDAAAWLRQRIDELEARVMELRLPLAEIPMVAAAQLDRSLTVELATSLGAAVASLRGRLGELRRDPRRRERALALCQLHADGLFETVDLLTDAVAQRADAQVGCLLAGAEVLASAALDARVPGYRPAAALCYLDRGRGGEIRRARTRLAGGVILPVALIRVGLHSLATRLSTVLHEAGHQLAVDLGLLAEAARQIERTATAALGPSLGRLWASWTGELMADAWSVCTGGGALALDGLQRLLISMPRPLAYLFLPGDPHPPGMVRARFVLELARAVDPEPDPALERLARRWSQTYAEVPLAPERRALIGRLESAAPAVAEALHGHRFAGLGGQRLAVAAGSEHVRARTLAAWTRHAMRSGERAILELAPIAAIAVLCRARLDGALPPQAAEQASRRLLLHLAARRADSPASPPPAFYRRATPAPRLNEVSS